MTSYRYVSWPVAVPKVQDEIHSELQGARTLHSKRPLLNSSVVLRCLERNPRTDRRA